MCTDSVIGSALKHDRFGVMREGLTDMVTFDSLIRPLYLGLCLPMPQCFCCVLAGCGEFAWMDLEVRSVGCDSILFLIGCDTFSVVVPCCCVLQLRYDAMKSEKL